MDKPEIDTARILRGQIRAMLMEWISERVNEGSAPQQASLRAAAFMTAEALAMSKSSGLVDEYMSVVAPLFAQVSPEICTVHYTRETVQ